MLGPRFYLVAGLGILIAHASVTLAAYTGPTCGDVRVGSCPGEPFSGSSFTGVSCSANVNNVNFQGRVVIGEVATAKACAEACRFYSLAVTRVVSGSNPTRYTCACADNAINQGPVNCNPERPGYVAIYFHSADAQASGNSKRRLAERARLAAEKRTICPRNLTACKIPGSDDGFECIDIMTELESCGGCRHGVYEPAAPNHRVSSPFDEELVLPVVPASAEEPRRGADCTDPTRFGFGITCRQGECLPFA